MKIIDLREKLPINQARIDAGEKIPKRTKPIKRIVVHCTADDDKPGEDVYACAKYDINPNHISSKGCFTITYAYYIERVGKQVKIYWCVDHDIITWHVGIWNGDSLGIVVDKTAIQNAPQKRKAAVQLCAKLCKDLNLTADDVVFHRELQYTGWNWNKQHERILRKTCPGLVWDADTFRADVSTELLIDKHVQIIKEE